MPLFECRCNPMWCVWRICVAEECRIGGERKLDASPALFLESKLSPHPYDDWGGGVPKQYIQYSRRRQINLYSARHLSIALQIIWAAGQSLVDYKLLTRKDFASEM